MAEVVNQAGLSESRTDLDFVDIYGYPISIHQLLEPDLEEDIIAFSSDNRVVKLTDAMRVSGISLAGCGGDGHSLWSFDVLHSHQEGLWDVMSALHEAKKAEKARRIAKKISWKRWEKNAVSIGYDLVYDPEFVKEILSVGLEAYLRQMK